MSSLKEEIIAVFPDARFSPAANEEKIALAEIQMGITIPDALRWFLKDADGVKADYGSGLIWSIEEIQTKNAEFRTLADFRELYMPFTALLFFADDGGGDQFAFPVHADGVIHREDVFRWDHETDARIWFAGNLSRYVQMRSSDSNNE